MYVQSSWRLSVNINFSQRVDQPHFYYMMAIYTLAKMHLDFMASDIPHEMVSDVNNACESWIYVYIV